MSTAVADSPAATLATESLQAAAKAIDDGILQIDFVVPAMHCIGCIRKIERELSKLPHVQQVRANLSLKRVSVTWRAATDQDSAGHVSDIDHTLTALGFEHMPIDLHDSLATDRDKTGAWLLRCLAVAGFAAANIMLLSVSVWSGADGETAMLFQLISGLIALPAVVYAGQPFFRSAARVLAVGHLNMDVPISLAVLLATAMGIYESLFGGREAYFDAAVTLLFFLLIGRYLDHLMRTKARGAVARLARLSAKGALVVEEGSTRYVPVDEIEPGMCVRIPAGERVPVDGDIAAGVSEVDRSLVTGEANAIQVGKGDALEAGILNLTAAIDLRVRHRADQSFLAEIMKLMQAAENGRGRYVSIADRMAQFYAPAVHLLALFTFIGWMFASAGDWHASLYTAIAVLIITCPCALGLAVPIVHVVGANRLLQAGILIRDGTAFERLAEITAVIFDKTGTLTHGKPAVKACSSETQTDAAVIKALASQSRHPNAQAVAAYYSDVETSPSALTAREIPGYGLEAEENGRRLRLGKPAWVCALSNAQTDISDTATVAFVREGGVPVFYTLQDQVRPNAKAAMSALEQANLDLHVVSGDHRPTVAKIAGQLGLKEPVAEATPIQKINYLHALQARGARVLMVGDGLNDAPALAAGNVSMTPAQASDVGRAAADLVFTRASLLAIPFAHRVAITTGRLVRQNFALALLYNCCAVPLAVSGQVTPLFAAIAMSTSSLLVIANSLRLNLLPDPEKERSP